MIASGSSVRVVVTGSYGAFQGIGAQDAITQQLNNDGWSVVNWSENDPSFVSQVLDGDFLSRPYQTTLDMIAGNNYNTPSDIANEVAAAFGQGLGGTLPTATAVTQVNGVSTGQVQALNTYGVGAVAQSAASMLSGVESAAGSVLGGVQTVVIVAIVGIIAILIFAPKTIKTLGLA